MQIRDLIEELKRFPGTARVCVEVEASTGKHFDADTCTVNFTVEAVAPENDGAHDVKIILAP